MYRFLEIFARLSKIIETFRIDVRMKEESPTSGKFHQFVRNALIRIAGELCYAKLFVKKENEITFRNTDLVVCLGASHGQVHLGLQKGGDTHLALRVQHHRL